MPFLLLIFLTIFYAPKKIVYACQNGAIHFVSNAPLELIEASSSQLKGIIRVQDQGFAFSVANSTFNGFNTPLQKEHFNENYMESKIYPKLSFRGKIIEPVDFTKNGKQKVRAKGILNVHGVEQERIIPAEIQISSNNIKVNAKFTVLLQDHNITIPKIVYQKIAEEIAVDVNANLTLK